MTSMATDPTGARQPRKPISFLVRNALSLVSTSALTSGLGFVFWAVAARFFSTSEVGEAATAIAAMNLLSTLATLGFGTMLMSELPRMTHRRSDLVVMAGLLSGLAGAFLAVVAGVALPTSFLGLIGIGTSVPTTALFAAGVGAAAVGAVLDYGLLSMLGGGPQLGRNSILSVGKLALLVGFALTMSQHGSLGIYGSWLLGNVLSILGVGTWIAVRMRIRPRGLRLSLHLLHGLRRGAAAHHALNLALQVPYFAMPIVASVALGSAGAGVLYATWSVAGFVFVLPIALSTSLFASGARDAAHFGHQFRFSLRSSMLACLAANIVILPLGGLVLRVFGRQYADEGHLTLILLCLSGFMLIIKDHHVSVARVTGLVGREALVIWPLTLVEIGGASLGAALGGLEGLALGFLAATLVEGAILGPLVIRTLRHGATEAVVEPATS